MRQTPYKYMLQFITQTNERYGYFDAAATALKGGCRWIQLRMKDAGDDEVLAVAHPLRTLCRQYGATLILDDRVHLVAACGADGVHLGKHDMPPDEARRLLGGKAVIGGTANTFGDIERLIACGVDYIGLGPFRFTETKKNLSPVLGLEGYRSLLQQCRAKGYTIPVVAIGGIERGDIPALMATGIAGIALSGTILRADDPVTETKNIIDTIKTFTL